MAANPIMHILLTRGEVPGMPGAGHIANGFWHPGSKRNCPKGNCDKDNTRDNHRRKP